MAGDKIPTLRSLERPEKYQDLLKQEKEYDDCTACRIVGTYDLLSHMRLGLCAGSITFATFTANISTPHTHRR